MRLQLRQVPSSDFSVDRANKSIFGEYSSFRGSCALVSRVYDDACDLGFEIVCSRNGNVSTWILQREIRQEGDLVASEFAPSNETVAQFPALSAYTLTLFND